MFKQSKMTFKRLMNMQQRYHKAVYSVFEVFIFIVTTITIISCKDVERPSTVRNSITDAGFNRQHGFVSTSVPNYLNLSASESAIDACKINQTLVISENPVRFRAFSGKQLCSVLLTTSKDCL